MYFSFNWLKEFVEIDKSADEIAELLTCKTAEVVSFQKKNKDVIFDLDILPNRGDLTGHLGIAREIAAIERKKISLKELKSEEENTEIENYLTVEIEDFNDCPRYMARVIEDVKIGPSPEWLKEKLENCGIQSINNVVDITNYIMLELGQPLHAFDGEKIALDQNNKRKIIVRRAKEGEEIITLDGIKRKLKNNVLIIADFKKPIAVAGIMGGANSEIDENTKMVILESANFNPILIRKAAKFLNLRTEAEERFEKNLDFYLAELALERATSLIKTLAGGKIVKGKIDQFKTKPPKTKIEIKPSMINDYLGTDLKKEEIKDILLSLQFKIEEKEKDLFEVEVPSFRKDIKMDKDLIEEIARIYGFEKIPSTLPKTIISQEFNKSVFLENQVRHFLKNFGFFEIYTYTFLSKEILEKTRLEAKNCFKIKNPLSNLKEYMRTTLIPNLLETSYENLKNFDKFRLFELGRVYLKEKKPPETQNLGLAIVGEKNEKGFFLLKGILEEFLKTFKIENWDLISIEKTSFPYLHPGKSAQIMLENNILGVIGEIHPLVLYNFEIKKPVVILEINFDLLKKFAQPISKEIKLEISEAIYKPISKFQATERDLAFLVDKDLDPKKLETLIREVDKLIKRVELFDEYYSEKLGKDKKSLAYHITLQAEDRTLKEEEINEIISKIIQTVEEKTGGKLRGK